MSFRANRQTDRVTLGNTLRGARLGFYHTKRLGGFVRISDGGNNQFLLEYCSQDQLPKGAYKKEEFFVWWDKPEGISRVNQISIPRRVGSFYIKHKLTEEGDLVTSNNLNSLQEHR